MIRLRGLPVRPRPPVRPSVRPLPGFPPFTLPFLVPNKAPRKGKGRRTKPTSLNPLTQSVLYFKAGLSPLLTPAESPCTFIGGGRVWDPNGDGLRKGVPHCMAGREREGAERNSLGKAAIDRPVAYPPLPDYPPTLLPPEWHTPTHPPPQTHALREVRPDPLSCRFLPPEAEERRRRRSQTRQKLSGAFPTVFCSHPTD